MSILAALGTSALGTAASTLTNAALSGVNRWMNRKSMEDQLELQNKYNKEMLDYQNNINLENWERNNDYNSPANQRKLLEDAGLNPNLMYDGYSLATADAVTAGSSNGSASSNVSMSPHSFDQALALMNAQTQEKVGDAQANNLDAQAEKAQAEKDRLAALTPLDAALKQSEKEWNDIRNAFEKAANPTRLEILNLEKVNKEHQNAFVQSQIALNEKNMAVMDQQIKESCARIDNIETDTQLKRVETSMKQQLTQLYAMQTLVEQYKGDKAQLEYALSRSTYSAEVANAFNKASEQASQTYKSWKESGLHSTYAKGSIGGTIATLMDCFQNTANGISSNISTRLTGQPFYMFPNQQPLGNDGSGYKQVVDPFNPALNYNP